MTFDHITFSPPEKLNSVCDTEVFNTLYLVCDIRPLIVHTIISVFCHTMGPSVHSWLFLLWVVFFVDYSILSSVLSSPPAQSSHDSGACSQFRRVCLKPCGIHSLFSMFPGGWKLKVQTDTHTHTHSLMLCKERAQRLRGLSARPTTRIAHSLELAKKEG